MNNKFRMDSLRVLSEIAEFHEYIKSDMFDFDGMYQSPPNISDVGFNSEIRDPDPIDDEDLNSVMDMAILDTSYDNELCKLSCISLDEPYKLDLNVFKSYFKPKTIIGRPVSRIINAKFHLHENIDNFIKYMKRPSSFAPKYQPKVKSMVFNNSEVVTNLCENYGISSVTFTKIIRNTSGKLVKIEFLETNGITIEGLKKKICYPRYKTGMSLHLVQGHIKPQAVYFDDKVYHSDKENHTGVVFLV